MDGALRLTWGKLLCFTFVCLMGRENLHPESQLNISVYWLNIKMKDFPVVQSSLIARPVQKTRIKQRAKQMAQMRAGRGS